MTDEPTSPEPDEVPDDPVYFEAVHAITSPANTGGPAVRFPTVHVKGVGPNENNPQT